MSGCIKMYAARQIIRHDVPVELPNCMYTLANIHRNGGGCVTTTTKASATKVQQDISEQNNSGLRGMAELESKQQMLLKQLEELKQQMLGIKDDLKAVRGSSPVTSSTYSKKASTKAATNKSLKVSDVSDVVINAHPDFPPHSLELLQKHWSKSVQVCVTTHVHSTVSSLPEAATALSERLSGFVQKNTDAPKISIRLIWKNIGFNQMELMVSPVPVLDECNFLRHICRLTGGLSYDERNFEIDDLLDLSYSIAKSQTKQKRMELIQQVNRRLGKGDFLLGQKEEGGFGVADVALYSAIKQVAQGAEINVNLTRWMKNCEALVAA